MVIKRTKPTRPPSEPAPTSDSPHPPRAVWCATKDCLNDIGDGQYTVRIDAHPAYRRDDGTPAQLGDVLSCQDDGTLQARVEGTDGYSERVVLAASGAGVIFRPPNNGFYAWFVPFTDVWPNQ